LKTSYQDLTGLSLLARPTAATTLELSSLDPCPPEASVLIPCFNGARYLAPCLESLIKTIGVDFEIIIVDNASTDNTVEIVRRYTQVRIIRNRRNVGFPIAINQGAAAARGKFLAILNQDTEVEPNWLRELISVLKENPNAAICGPKILDQKNRTTVQQLGVMVDRFGFAIYINRINRDVSEVFMVSCTAMVIRHDVFDALQGLDEDYFMFEEDLDLCWRAHLTGYKIMVNSRSIVFHRGGSAMEGGFPNKEEFKSSLARRYLSERNTLQTLLKNYETANIIKRVPAYLGMNIAEMVLFVFLRRMSGTAAYLKSFYYNVTRFSKTWQKHVEVDRMRLVSDKDMYELLDRRNLKIQAFLQWGAPTFDGFGLITS
jgi:GT2 family glycosyltransferase